MRIRWSVPVIACTDCLDGFHDACDETAWDDVAEEDVTCDCWVWKHEPPWLFPEEETS